MKWSWRFATVRGIDIKVHATFVLALIWGAYMWRNGTPSGALYGVFLTLLLFVVVVLHELGHAIAAQRYGIEVYDIVLLPIGGVARLSHMPEKPIQELVVALAGPAVNLALVLALAPVLAVSFFYQAMATGEVVWPAMTMPGWLNLAAFLALVNVSLLVFNLLPAFPMDGGRVLRALLALRWPYLRATRAAVLVGRVFALGFGALAIYTGNFFLGIVALFIFNGAGAEGQAAEQDAREERTIPVDDVAQRAPVLPADMPAYVAFERLMRSPYPALAVVNHHGDFVGLVTRAGMQNRWAAGVRGPVGLFVEPAGISLAHSGLPAD